MRFFRFGAVAAAALALAACGSDPLNVDPTAQIPTETAIQKAADVTLALRGAYDSFQSSRIGGADGTYSRNLIVFPDLYADNLRFTGTFTTDQEVGARNIASSNGAVAGIWAAGYEQINRVNTLLAGMGKASDLSQSEAARIRGEALFLRGLSYFNLVRFFGGVPLKLEATEAVTEQSLVPRNTPAEVYAQIEKDLTEASTLLAAASTPARATRGAADALLARVYLEQGKWAEARARADAVIASGRYTLVTNYASLFSTKNPAESIFEIQYTSNDTNSLAFWFFTRGLGGRWGFSPTDNLVAAFEGTDTRRAASIATGESNRLYGRKYNRITTNDDNVIVLRLAEMYLIRAEAAARLGGAANLTAALADVNVVRRRAGLTNLPATVATQAQVLDAILRERRVEFAFEGHRFFDLRRFGAATTVLGLTQNRLLFPIPQREIDVNPKLQQNPGY